MSRLEHALASIVLRILGVVFDRLPIRQRVVLATARVARLEGNLAYLDAEIRRTRPGVELVTLARAVQLRPRRQARVSRAPRARTYLLRTSSLFVVDNAYLPVHVAPHRARTTVVQVWHAVGALKRFGADTTTGLTEPERSFLHRHYDYVVCAGEESRRPYAAALRTPVERVAAARGRPDRHLLRPRRARRRAGAGAHRIPGAARRPGGAVRPHVPRARPGKARGAGLRSRGGQGGSARGHVLALKSHPNLDPAHVSVAGYDVVIDPAQEINEVFAATDVLVTDYSSSIYEWALLRRPLVLLTQDLAEYERDPGLYLDARTELIGEHVDRLDDLPRAIAEARVDAAAWQAFVERRIGACDGHASARFVERFLPA